MGAHYRSFYSNGRERITVTMVAHWTTCWLWRLNVWMCLFDGAELLMLLIVAMVTVIPPVL